MITIDEKEVARIIKGLDEHCDCCEMCSTCKYGLPNKLADYFEKEERLQDHIFTTRYDKKDFLRLCGVKE